MCLMLVVDDDEIVLESITEMLTGMGHTIIQARDGLEALSIYQEKHETIDLVLMDIVMPRMEGTAATRAIKAAHPLAKVILMSGFTDKAIPPQADAYISKPFRRMDLHEKIERVLSKPCA